MGFYRLFLAFLVMVMHVSGSRVGALFWGHGNFHLGVIAVNSFFLLSGFVMTLLIQKYYASPKEFGRFYLDRAVRLMPQYLFYFVVTVVGAYWFGLHNFWMSSPPSVKSSLLQLAIFPLNFEWLFANDFVLPAAWSLGLEAFFYLLFPFVLFFRARGLVFALSIAIFLLGYSGLLNTDAWTYRYLAGTFFIFICGSWIAQPETRADRWLPWIVTASMLILLGVTYIYPTLNVPYSRSVLVGVAIGIPVVSALRNFKSWGYLDDLAGNVSYGLFLNHIMINSIVVRLNAGSNIGMSPIFEVFVCGSLLSLMSFTTFEKPLINLRRSFRKKMSVRNPPMHHDGAHASLVGMG